MNEWTPERVALHNDRVAKGKKGFNPSAQVPGVTAVSVLEDEESRGFYPPHPWPEKPIANPKKRVRQGEKKPNKWEREYHSILNAKQVLNLKEQSIRFRLANGAWYKPDITGDVEIENADDVYAAGEQKRMAWEIKGGKGMKGHAKSMQTLKFAADKHRDWTWILVTRDGGVWREQEILP